MTARPMHNEPCFFRGEVGERIIELHGSVEGVIIAVRLNQFMEAVHLHAAGAQVIVPSGLDAMLREALALRVDGGGMGKYPLEELSYLTVRCPVSYELLQHPIAQRSREILAAANFDHGNGTFFRRPMVIRFAV